ncbi:hypothetical protein B0H10DRAFT_1949513 [Mycena sp. CBHHK59/15]|nr:hypothetical protein B0H10DRAFT_1949513 [Mycena sp. CBHHK59/15]
MSSYTLGPHRWRAVLRVHVSTASGDVLASRGGMGASGRVQSQLDGPAMLPATHVAATTAGGGHLGRKAWAQAHSLARYPPLSTLQLQWYSVGKAEMVVVADQRVPPEIQVPLGSQT